MECSNNHFTPGWQWMLQRVHDINRTCIVESGKVQTRIKALQRQHFRHISNLLTIGYSQ